MIEVEIKLKIDNIEVIRRKLINLGFSECDTLTEIDTYFDNKIGEIRSSDSALRIRETINHTNASHLCQVNFKGKKYDNISMTRPEFETLIEDKAAMMGILKGLGYSPVQPIVKKLRRELVMSNINACLDTVDGLGDYLEIEIVIDSEEDKDRELERIQNILSKIGYSMADTTTRSYLSQLCDIG